MNANEQLRLVVRFVESALDRLREGEWLDLQTDILHYVDWPKSRRGEVTREALQKIQHEIAPVLAEYARPQGERDERKLGLHIALAAGKMTFTLGSAGTRLDLIDGSLSDSLKLALTYTLAGVEDGLLRTCQASDCHRLFLAEHGRQLYHSPLCAKRENMRLLRARQQGKDEPVRNKGKRSRHSTSEKQKEK